MRKDKYLLEVRDLHEPTLCKENESCPHLSLSDMTSASEPAVPSLTSFITEAGLIVGFPMLFLGRFDDP